MSLSKESLALAERAWTLKRTVRSGWTRVPVWDPESVAEHSWGVATLALLASIEDPSLDRGKLLTLALVHDLSEAITGDLTPHDVASDAQKRALDRAGLAALLASAPPGVAVALDAAWEDYERRGSREAALIADLDKVEMALQAQGYAREGADAARLEEFWRSALEKVKGPGARETVAALRPR